MFAPNHEFSSFVSFRVIRGSFPGCMCSIHETYEVTQTVFLTAQYRFAELPSVAFQGIIVRFRSLPASTPSGNSWRSPDLIHCALTDQRARRETSGTRQDRFPGHQSARDLLPVHLSWRQRPHGLATPPATARRFEVHHTTRQS